MAQRRDRGRAGAGDISGDSTPSPTERAATLVARRRRPLAAADSCGAALAALLAVLWWGGAREASALVNLFPACADGIRTDWLLSAGAFHSCATNGSAVPNSETREFRRSVRPSAPALHSLSLREEGQGVSS